MVRYPKADLGESSLDGSVSRPACLVLSAKQVDSLWRNLLERAGLQLTDHCGGARPSLVVVFASFTSPVAEMGPATVPVILVTNDGTAVLADPGGQLRTIPPDRVQEELDVWLRRFHRNPCPAQRITGETDTAKRLRLRAALVGASEASVLVSGESGTGKELVALMLHENSNRRRGRLVCVNCAALPDALVESELFGYETGAFTGAKNRHDGAFARANGGTLFLDEVGDMSLYAQAKVLRAIEARRVSPLGSNVEVPVDVRIVAASNRDLPRMMTEGTFRQDLYFRLAVVEISVPPLRDRLADLPELVSHLASELGQRSGKQVDGASDSVLRLFKGYDWGGNVRELKNVIEAALITCGGPLITEADLPEAFCRRLNAPDLGERVRILTTLQSVNGNKSQAAKRLHWSRVTLYRKLASHGIERSRDDESPQIPPLFPEPKKITASTT